MGTASITSSSSIPLEEAGVSPEKTQTNNPSRDGSGLPAVKSTSVQDTPTFEPEDMRSVTSAADEVEHVLSRSITPPDTVLKSMISDTATERPSREGAFEINVSSSVTADEKTAQWSAAEDKTSATEIIYIDGTTTYEDPLGTAYVKSEIVEGNEELEMSAEDLKQDEVYQDKIPLDVAALSF